MGGDSQDSKPRELKVRIAGPVALERRTGAVVLEAVELHDDPRAKPYGVDLLAGDGDVDRRWGQPGVVTEAQEPAFQLGPGLGDGPLGLGEQGRKPPQAAVSVRALA